MSLERFGATVNSVTGIKFIFTYVLLLLNLFVVTVNSVTVIQFSSQYVLLLHNSFVVTVNSVNYSVQFTIHNFIAQFICFYSEFCDCYLVQFSIHTVIAQFICCYIELCDLFGSVFNTYIYCSIHLLFQWILWLIRYSSQYVLLLHNSFDVTVNSVTYSIQFSKRTIIAQFIFLLQWIL
jgi:hypothetical protein